MTVTHPFMSGSSHVQIGTREESARCVGIPGKTINMSRGTFLNTISSSPSSFLSPQSSIAMNPPPKVAVSYSSMPPPSTNSIYQATTTNSTASSSHTSGGSCPPTYSGSDDEQHHHQHHYTTDERRQKRMLSNRESARRSRMRKQQHLDDLRAQVVQLRAENNHIFNKLNAASQQYMQVEDENRALRSYCMDLSQKLQGLYIALQQAGEGLNSMEFDSEFMDSILMPKMDVNPFS